MSRPVLFILVDLSEYGRCILTNRCGSAFVCKRHKIISRMAGHRKNGILLEWDDVGWHGIKGRPLIMEGVSRGWVVASFELVRATDM